MDYGQENFTLPHDVVQLPSQGIFYKNKKKSIKVGYLTASDENILMVLVTEPPLTTPLISTSNLLLETNGKLPT